MRPMSAYGVVHYLLRQTKGPARDLGCVSCEKTAAHWAYDHLDVFERIDPETHQLFSVNFNHYQPMCSRCHQRLDKANEPRVADEVQKYLRSLTKDAA